MEELTGAVYLFEPGNDFQTPPLALQKTPALSTLSPYNARIKEYKKARFASLFFPTWSLRELIAAGHGLVEVFGSRFPVQINKRHQ